MLPVEFLQKKVSISGFRQKDVTHPCDRTQPAAAKLFICFCSVHGFEEEDSLENLHSVLFCLIEKRSV